MTNAQAAQIIDRTIARLEALFDDLWENVPLDEGALYTDVRLLINQLTAVVNYLTPLLENDPKTTP